jgi:hypothetical protein
MTRILLVETASPKRVRRKAEEILAVEIYPNPEITILTNDHPRIVQYLRETQGIRVIAIDRDKRRQMLRALRRERFDILYVFWTGEKRYRRNKLLAMRMNAAVIEVDIGDEHRFHLSWKNLLRFCLIRWKYPLPSDHYDFYQRWADQEDVDPHEGEKILVIQSAEPPYVLAALEKLDRDPLFQNPRYTLFCRNKPEITRHFIGNPMLHEVRTHSETSNTWDHLRQLRRDRYDAVVVFFTGDPSYWKIKYFAFMLGARHKLIVNENNDCFFFSWGAWLALMAHRMGEKTRRERPPRWTYQLRLVFFLMAKIAVFPLRFLWLLLVWLRLRAFAMRFFARGSVAPGKM